MGLTLVAAAAFLTLVGAVVQATLQGVYAASLYRYAMGQPGPGGFSGTLLEQAFSKGKPTRPSPFTLR